MKSTLFVLLVISFYSTVQGQGQQPYDIFIPTLDFGYDYYLDGELTDKSTFLNDLSRNSDKIDFNEFRSYSNYSDLGMIVTILGFMPSAYSGGLAIAGKDINILVPLVSVAVFITGIALRGSKCSKSSFKIKRNK